MIEESSEECLKRCAGTTIVVGEEILLAKRCEFWQGKPAPLPGFWSIFAGAVEPGESVMNCAIRELREESCIDIEIHQLQYINDLIDDDKQLTVYITELKKKPEVILNDEHTDFLWFSIEKIKDFPYNIQDDLIECILMYQSKRYRIT